MIDQRDRLLEEPFSFKVNKNQTTMIYFNNKHIMTLSEKETVKLLERIKNKSESDIQLALAKVTGNFKHGNEKSNKSQK